MSHVASGVVLIWGEFIWTLTGLFMCLILIFKYSDKLLQRTKYKRFASSLIQYMFATLGGLL
jgi:hypothetical protein